MAISRQCNNSIYVYIGNSISRVRRESALSQAELAKRIGMSQQYVASIEAGERRVQIGELLKVAELFQLPIEEFLPGRKEQKKTGPKPKVVLACEKLQKLPEKEQRVVMSMIDTISEAKSL